MINMMKYITHKVRCQWNDYYDYRLLIDNIGHVRVTFMSDYIMISDLNVVPAYRKQGIGDMLLDEADEIIRNENTELPVYICPLLDWESEWYSRRGYLIADKDI